MNLDKNNLVAFRGNESVANMNDLELEAFTQVATNEKMRRLSEKVNEMIVVQSNQGRDLANQGEWIETHCIKIDKIDKAINVIGFGANSRKGKILRRTCASRVHSILGDMGGYNYLLWNPYFFKKIYSDLGDHFNVDSYKNINVDDFEEAKKFASNWRPSERYIYWKTQEMIEKKDKGLLPQTRCMALCAYLQETENGTCNPF